jgi:ankyrin repeat protein
VAPDVENSNGKTALQMAVEAGNGKTTRVLIENGADPFGEVDHRMISRTGFGRNRHLRC